MKSGVKSNKVTDYASTAFSNNGTIRPPVPKGPNNRPKSQGSKESVTRSYKKIRMVLEEKKLKQLIDLKKEKLHKKILFQSSPSPSRTNLRHKS